ncbi:MAG: hypothetical protein LBI64_02945 [Coriobacteriales bacterium]|jgi:hypothetical protein|nr:hypothetical protein [Coriobacteriales bacterium]
MINILGRIDEKHPDLKTEEILSAWESRVKTQFRLTDEREYMVAVGVSSSGKLIEMIAFDDGEDTVIFHAMKATKKILTELNMLSVRKQG